MMSLLKLGSATLVLLRGDITQQETDAIVNAANSGLLGGGGVDGAIHRAGGPAILEECSRIRRVFGECPAGEAVMTGGGNLHTRHVIHAVGPVWRGGRFDEGRLLARTYRRCLEIAAGHNLQSVSFPCISTGVYRFPAERAAIIAFDAVRTFVAERSPIMEIRFIVFSESQEALYRRLFEGKKPAQS